MIEEPSEDEVRRYLIEMFVAAWELTNRIAQLRADQRGPIMHRPLSLLQVAAAHVDALRHFAAGAETARPFVPFSLFVPFGVVRTAIESAATSLWLLGPESDTERVVRGLRLELTEREDFDKAVSRRDPGHMVSEIKKFRTEILDLARQATGSPAVQLPRVRTTTVLEYAASQTPSAGNVVGAWQICSGFAHGRTWPARVITDRADGDVSYVALAEAVGVARHLMARALEIYHLR